jgi:hypothetical protein
VAVYDGRSTWLLQPRRSISAHAALSSRSNALKRLGMFGVEIEKVKPCLANVSGCSDRWLPESTSSEARLAHGVIEYNLWQRHRRRTLHCGRTAAVSTPYATVPRIHGTPYAAVQYPVRHVLAIFPTGYSQCV